MEKESLTKSAGSVSDAQSIYRTIEDNGTIKSRNWHQMNYYKLIAVQRNGIHEFSETRNDTKINPRFPAMGTSVLLVVV